MSEVKRYDLCEFDGGLIARDSGFLVGAEDYDAIHKRLTDAEKFVQKMVDCTKGQDSIATGYLSDILDVVKGNKL